MEGTELELTQGLQEIGYKGPYLDAQKLSQLLNAGPKSVEFTGFVAWLVQQISSFSQYDETVTATSSPEDASSFILELTSFLKEMGCVNQRLLNNRLMTKDDRALLIEYLIAELMASKILKANKPETKSMEITVDESITAKCIREMSNALKFQQPPDKITAQMLFKKLHAKISELLRQVPTELIGRPLFIGELNNSQWEKLNKLQGDLNKEYTIRREMLLKRLDVTVQSFLWSDRTKQKEKELNTCYQSKRDLMRREPDVSLAHLLAARDDLAIIEKTSSASVRKNTRSLVNRVIIGNVPDRGGRPCEQEPPPPEMPPWQKDRVAGPPSFRGGRGGGTRGSGGGGGGGGGRGGGGNYGKDVSNNFGQNFSSSYQQQQTFTGNQGDYQRRSSGGFSSGSGGYGGGGGGYSTGGGTYSSGGGGGYTGKVGYATTGYTTGGSSYGSGSRVQGGWNQGSGEKKSQPILYNHISSDKSSSNESSNQRNSGGYNRGGRGHRY